MDLSSDVTLECVLLLESAFQADPEAIRALIDRRVPCNMQLADHAHVVVQPRANDQEPDSYEVGMLGVINGILSQMGQKRVAAKYSDDSLGEEKLIGFMIHEPKPEASTDQLGQREASIRAIMEVNAKLRDVAEMHRRLIVLTAGRDDNYVACLATVSAVLDRVLVRAADILEKFLDQRKCNE